MAFTTFVAGAQALSQHLLQVLEAFNGNSGKGQPIALNATSLPSNYVVHLKQLDDTNGYILLAERADGTDILNATKDGLRFSPDGSTAGLTPASTAGTETLTNKTLDSSSNALVKIDSKSGASASYDFTDISGGFTHLQLRIYGRCGDASSQQAVQVRFNGDSGNNYDYLLWYITSAGLSQFQTNAAAQALAGIIPGSTAGASLFSSSIVTIPDYVQTTGNKTLHVEASHKIGTGGTDLTAYHITGFWRSSVAINQITLTPAAGAFIAGSRADLYGIPG